MRLYEFESKELLKRAGISVPRGRLIAALEDIGSVGDDEFPIAAKSQVLTGGRMKAGGIAFAQDATELTAICTRLLGTTIRGHEVDRLLLEPRVDVAREYYLGVTYDSAAKTPVAIFSRSGGIDVEEAGAVHKAVFPLLPPPSSFRFKELLANAGVEGRLLSKMTDTMTRLAELFLEHDCTLAEINPLAVTASGDLLALDAHIDLDEDAFYRHRDLVSDWSLDTRDSSERTQSEFERKAAEIDTTDHRGVAGRMVAFDGTLGLLIGGGGASLTAFDAVRRHGGTPANYCEIGGNPSVWKVKELTKLIMGKPGVEKLAVIMNVVSNTRVDLVARGVVKAMLELGLEPSERVAIFRIPGAWEDDGFAILRKYGVPYVDRTVSIDEAARRAVTSEGS
ncbi:MAG: ATP-grasp domain-containing protein [Thermoleophilia bacterium]